MIEFGLDPTKVTVTMKYILNNDPSPIKIKSERSLLLYMTLEVIDRNLSKFPISSDVSTLENGQ